MAHLSILVLSILTFLCPLPSRAQVLDQDYHNRMLFTESRRGTYLKSTTFIKGVVRFDFCGENDPYQCRVVAAHLPHDQIDSYQQKVLSSLKAYREILSKKTGGLFSIFTGGPTDQDLKSLDALIANIEKGGLKNWVLLTKQNLGEDSPAFGSPEVADEVVRRLAEAFRQPDQVASGKISKSVCESPDQIKVLSDQVGHALDQLNSK